MKDWLRTKNHKENVKNIQKNQIISRVLSGFFAFFLLGITPVSNVVAMISMCLISATFLTYAIIGE
jgi:hypothetical protein